MSCSSCSKKVEMDPTAVAKLALSRSFFLFYNKAYLLSLYMFCPSNELLSDRLCAFASASKYSYKKKKKNDGKIYNKSQV